jgi:tetratricopeptide (TPR) repeat protein
MGDDGRREEDHARVSRHRPVTRRRQRAARADAARRRAARTPFWSVPAAPAAPALDASVDDFAQMCEDARTHLEAGRAAEAAAAARRALGVLPRAVEGHRLLGLALLEQGDLRPALAALQEALAGDPIDVVALVGIAEAQEAIAGAAAAEPDWLRAWEAVPGYPAIEARLLAARGARGRPALTRPALLRIYLRGGLYEHAIGEARTLLGREPDRADLTLLLAEAHWRSGDSDAAAAVAGTLLERLPDCAAANLIAAAHWHALGKDHSALLARLKAADPLGEVAARLFDDREPPPLFDADAGAALWSREASSSGSWAAAGTPLRSAEATQRLAVAPRPPVAESATPAAPAAPGATPEPAAPAAPEPAAAVEPAAPAEAPEAAETVGVAWRGGPVAAAPGPAHVEPETHAYGTRALGLTDAPARQWRAAPVESAAMAAHALGDLSPLAATEPAVEAPATEAPLTAAPAEASPMAGVAGTPEAGAQPGPKPREDETAPPAPEPAAASGSGAADDPDARQRGDAAMRAGRYLEAMAAYGAALRALRPRG